MRWRLFLSASILSLALGLAGASASSAQTGATDYALGATVYPSGLSFPTDHPASRMVDGNDATPTYTSGAYSWLMVDLGQPREIHSWRTVTGEYGDVNLQFSPDGANTWTTAVTPVNPGTNTATFGTPITAQHWRLERSGIINASTLSLFGPVPATTTTTEPPSSTTSSTTAPTSTTTTTEPAATPTTSSPGSSTTTTTPPTDSGQASWDDGMTPSDFRAFAGVIGTTLGLCAGAAFTGRRT